MAKKEENICTCEHCQSNNFSVKNGFIFGFGFLLANLVGVLIIVIIAWIVIFIARSASIVI